MEAQLHFRRNRSIVVDVIVEVLFTLGTDSTELILSVLLKHPGRDQVAQKDGSILVDSDL